MDDTVQLLKSHAVKVMSVLGKGHSERVYHKAMITSLNKKGLMHRSEVIAPIYFMGEVVGFGRCDLIIDDLIVEFKANKACPAETSPQVKKYMSSLTKSEQRFYRGVIINFNQKSGCIEVLEERQQPPSTKAKKARGSELLEQLDNQPPKPKKAAREPEPLEQLDSLRYSSKRRKI